MRIIAGKWKGRRIEAPEGRHTRPTTDRVREALFSTLYSHSQGFEGMAVLDGFAGSGALGLEALSRGADSALFYENDPKALSVLKKNLSNFGVDVSAVHNRDVLLFPPRDFSCANSLILLDPPYATKPQCVLDMVANLPSASKLIAYEHSVDMALELKNEAFLHGFELLTIKIYGNTATSVLKGEQ